METKFSDRVRFLTVYIKEAHADDEWQMRDNEREGLVYDQPQTIERRVEIAREFIEKMNYSMEVVVDPIDNSVGEAFAAWPERIYILDGNGKVAYKGKPGPGGFDIDEVNTWLLTQFP